LRAAAAPAHDIALFRNAGVDDLGIVVMAIRAFHVILFFLFGTENGLQRIR
jgi:hypothetical protein